MKWVISLLSLILLVTGCSQASKSSTHENQTHIQQSRSTTKADHLVQLATRVKGVKGATAVVVNKVAVVGIDVDDKLERSRVGTIKYSVAESLKEDPLGATALVTADPDLVQRIREMNEDIRKGRPIAGIAEELADITGRIIPQSPLDIHPKPKQQK
jgi:YhcN/YlaJ family sporulation lipoprotein